jgi:MFS family permease
MRGIDRNVVMLGWVSFFTDMASAMINPILPIFVVTVLHEGIDKLGIVVAVATFVSYILRLLSGYISDRYGIVKPLVVGGYALSALSKPLIGLSEGYRSVAAFKALERFGKGLRSAPKDAMIAHYSPKRSSGRTFGFHKTLDIAGELSGTLILFALLLWLGQGEAVMRGIFYATLIPGLAGLLILLFFVRDIPKKARRRQAAFRLTDRDRETVRSLVFYFLFLLFMFNEAFFTMQAKSVGIATAVIPLLFVVSTGTQTLTSYLFGLWIDRIGVRRVLLAAYLCGIVALAMLYGKHPALTWVAYAFLGLFTVASLNANRALIASGSDNRGSVYGIFYAGVALFGAAGALISGWLWQYVGMNAAMGYALGGTSLMTLLYLLRGVRRG